MIEYWIKIWSTNENLFQETIRLYGEQKISGVEIYIVPDTVMAGKLDIFRRIKTSIHAPHFLHGFNIFNLNEKEIILFKKEVIATANSLNASEVVVHAGCGNEPRLFQDQVKKIADPRVIIENKPAIALNGERCFGYNMTQLKFIKQKCNLNICLDIGHAIRSAEYQKIDYKRFLEEIIQHLSPSYFHICGTDKGNLKDGHLNLWEDECDLEWIKKLIMSVAERKQIKLVFEVPKTVGLENDLKNINFFKDL